MDVTRSAPTDAASVDDPRVARALEEYAAAVEAGQAPHRDEFLARHADIAEALAESLEGLEMVQQAAPQLAHPAAVRHHGLAGAAEFWPAEALGDYRIVRELGRGGMGVVYEVTQVSLSRRVALKVLPFAASLDAKQLQRFKNEAQAAAQLHHQNIVPVYGVGCERGVHYYAMQYIDGQTLAALVDELRSLAGLGRPEPLPATFEAVSLAAELVTGRWAPATRAAPTVDPASQRSARSATTHLMRDSAAAAMTPASARSQAYFRTVANLARQAALALEHAHAMGVIHRDVKPGNLLVDSRGNLWMTDFGLAHCQNQDGLTMTGDLMGTLRYMSPEQALGQRAVLDCRTDIYSLGATLYELLTLEPVFSGRDRQELLRQIAHDDPRRPRNLNKAIPVELETIALKALEKNPADRFGTAQQLADDLQRYLNDEPIRACPPTLLEKAQKWVRRHGAVVRTAIVMLSVLVVTVAVVATAAAWRLEREKEATNEQLRLTQRAETEATRRLYRSLVEQARANRLTRRIGQRFQTLDILANAAKHARAVSLPEEDLLELRNEAVACLALTDLRDTARSCPVPAAVGVPVACDAQWRHYAYAGEEGKISLCRTDGNRAVAVLPGPGPDANCVDLRFSPDGGFLEAGYRFIGRDGSRTCIWNLRCADAPRQLLSEEAGSAAFSATSRWVALGQEDGSITIPSLVGRDVKRLEGHFYAFPMALHPECRLLAMGVWSAWRVWLIDTDSGQELATFAHHSEVHTLSFSSDGRLLAVGCDDRKVYVWDVPRRRLQAVLEGHEKQITTLAFSPRDELLATCARDGTTRLWDPIDGRQLVAAPGELIGFCDEGRQLALRKGERLGAWHIAHGGECRVLHHGRVGNRNPWPGHVGPESLAFHPHLPVLASTGGDGVRLWDVSTCRELAYLGTGHTEAVLFSPGGERLYTYGRLGLQSWPIGPEELAARNTLRIGPPDDIAASRGQGGFRIGASDDGRLLAISSRPGNQAYVFSTEQPDLRLALDDCPYIHSLALSPDGRWVAAGVVHQGIKVWDVASGTMVKYLPGLRTSVMFSPDGQWLLGGGPSDYQLWRTGSWKAAEAFAREHAEAWAGPIAFARDNRLLALAANLQQTRLIDFASRRELATFSAEGVSCALILSFDPTQRWLAISGENHTVQLWDLGAVRRVLRAMQLDWDPADIQRGAPPIAAAPAMAVMQFNFEAEHLHVTSESCQCDTQDMFPWGRERWSNGVQLWCRGAAGGYAELEFEVGESGNHQITLLFTREPKAGIFQVALDGENLGTPLDGFNESVTPSSPTLLGTRRLNSGTHHVRCTLLDTNPMSGGYQMGIDAIWIEPVAAETSAP